MRGGEEARLAALHGYGILDTENEPEFDAIVREAARILNTPIALVSLIDENRQWFKARIGLDVSETPRSISFCTHAIHEGKTMIVPDATCDSRFRDNPLVLNDPSIRFYAGAPLRTREGHRLGTLCVIDRDPRSGITPEQCEQLEALAQRTVDAFELRKAMRKSPAAA